MARPAVALALLALALAAAVAAPPKQGAREAPEWGVYRKNLKALRLPNGKAAGDVLGPLLDYEFSLPMEFIRRAQVGGGGAVGEAPGARAGPEQWQGAGQPGHPGTQSGARYTQWPRAFQKIIFAANFLGWARPSPVQSSPVHPQRPPRPPCLPPAPPLPQSYTGPRTRLRRVVADMLAGKPVEISVLGGSVSAGAIASRKMAAVDPNDVWNLVRIELQTSLSPKIEFYNNARSATKSYINSLCLSRFLNSTADLVFVEFIANDGSEMDTQLRGPLDKTRSFERFLRKIQGQPSAPAVVMMNVGARAPRRGCFEVAAPRQPETPRRPAPRPPHINAPPTPCIRQTHPPDAGERDGLPRRRHERKAQARVLLHPRGHLRQPGPVLRHPHHLLPVRRAAAFDRRLTGL
jgi:hypothetical protein